MLLQQDKMQSLKNLLLNEERQLRSDELQKLQKKLDHKIKLLSSSLNESQMRLDQYQGVEKQHLKYIESLQRSNQTSQSHLTSMMEVQKTVQAQLSAIKLDLTSEELFINNFKNSKAKVIDLISPMIGKIIRKAIMLEIDKLTNKIEATTKTLSSADYWKMKFKGIFGLNKGVALDQIGAPQIYDVLLIEQETGLLLGRYVDTSETDIDIVTGMLAAIKSFAETAFQSGHNELDLIEYDDYKIKLQAYNQFYFAVIFTGRNTPFFKEFLENEIDDFVNQNLNATTEIGPLNNMVAMSNLIKKHFDVVCKRLEKKLYS